MARRLDKRGVGMQAAVILENPPMGNGARKLGRAGRLGVFVEVGFLAGQRTNVGSTGLINEQTKKECPDGTKTRNRKCPSLSRPSVAAGREERLCVEVLLPDPGQADQGKLWNP